MQRLIYELDPHNRLIARSGAKGRGLSRFRHVINGEFKMGERGLLIYHIKSPSRNLAQQLNLPYQLKLSGRWSLTENHDLKITFDKCALAGFRNEIVLAGEIIGAEADSLLFSVTQKMSDNTTKTRILKMEGVWQADKQNRLTFKVSKEGGLHDTLIFEGEWEIDKNHQIIYKYKKDFSETGKKAERSLALAGFWNMTEKDTLTYHLDFIDRSFFAFKAGYGRAYNDRIKYEVGIGLKNKKRPRRKEIILYGKWNIRQGAGLIFEISYGSGQIGGMVFGAEARLGSNSKIEFDLRTASGKPLGMSLALSRTILKGSGELYSRALFSEKEKAVYIGGGFKW